MEGWITLNRSLLDHHVWSGEPFTRGQAWVDLLLIANHAPRRTMIDGQIIELQPGSYVTSIRRLADRWERSTKWTMKFLEHLESDNMIETKVIGNGNAKRTVLFIVKYGIYQASYMTEETQRNTQRKRKGNAKETQDGGKGVLDTNIDYINKQQGNNETMEQITPNILTDVTPTGVNEAPKKKRKSSVEPFKIPTVEEVETYCKERNNGIDPVYWWNYQNARGWEYKKGVKIKNWKSAIITWERNNKSNTKPIQRPIQEDHDLDEIL